jgi:histidyl-tRNA synthetase
VVGEYEMLSGILTLKNMLEGNHTKENIDALIAQLKTQQ